MNRLADSIILMWGWRRLALAFVAGALLVLALAPFKAVPVGWISIPILIWLIDGSATPEGTGFIRRLLPAAAVGWWFGFGYFLAGLWWIGSSFLVEADTFGWMMPFAVVALPAGLAIIWAIAIALCRLLWSDGWPRLLLFAVAMTAAEWVRGHALTGFPWNAVGYTIMPEPILMQSAAIVGVWGMTLLAFLVFAAPTLLAGETGRGRWAVLLGIIALVALDAGYGALRLRAADPGIVEGVRLRIVQAAIPQEVKQDRSQAGNNLQRHLSLSLTTPTPAQPGGPTHIIWPETAVPYRLTEEPAALAAIAEMLPDGTTLITGAPRRDPSGSGDTTNGVLVIGADGTISDSYDKVHLVPFGEYLPFADFLEGLGIREVISLQGGFAAGEERRNLEAPGIPRFSPLICYEIIFAGAVTPDGDRPGWLLNVTNDAWFGNTPGPRQHLQQALVRSVEEGLPLIRAANTGVSAIVDPYGRTISRLDLGEVGVIDGDLPQALSRTIYARFGDVFVGISALLLIVAALVGRHARLRRYN